MTAPRKRSPYRCDRCDRPLWLDADGRPRWILGRDRRVTDGARNPRYCWPGDGCNGRRSPVRDIPPPPVEQPAAVDPWREEFEKVPDTTGQTAIYFGDTLEDRTVTLADVERQARENADRVERAR